MYIIILIAIIILLLVGYGMKRSVENYKSPSYPPPNYRKYNTGLTEISNDPSGEPLAFNPNKNNFNYTQLYYAFLIQLFKTMSKDKKEYNKKLVKYYAKNTVDYHAMDALNMLMKPILKKMEKLSNGRCDFWLVGYESWKIYQVDDSALKINEIDCFIYDRIGWTEVRLLIQLAEVPSKNCIGKYECRKNDNPNLKTVAELTTPEFPTYPIGIGSNDQLIPLPTQVMISGNEVQTSDGINFPIPCSFEMVWVNWVEIVNSSLVLNAFEEYSDKQLSGLQKIPFDFTKYTPPGGRQNPYQWTAQATNQWPTLDDQPKDEKAWPCKTTPFRWNSLGVQEKVKPTARCPGVRHSLEQEPLTASFYNGYFDIPRKNTDYLWMFDNTAVIPALQYMG